MKKNWDYKQTPPLDPVRLMQFILTHLPISRDWDSAKTLGWLIWHRDQGFISRVLDDDGETLGIAIAHPIMNPLEKDILDYEGTCIFMDLVISNSPGVLKALGFAVLKRFGMRKTIAWETTPFHVTKEYSCTAFRRNLLRMDKLNRQEAA